MTNLEDSLPRFPTYQTALNKDGYKFGDQVERQIKELFDQSKWEDRLLMLAFIMQRVELKNDPRPSFAKWIKAETGKIEQDFLDYHFPSNRDRDKGIHHPDPYISAIERYSIAKDKINCDNLKKIIGKWNTYSNSEQKEKLTLNLMGVYLTMFPDSMVVSTTIGNLCISSCKDLTDNKQIKEYLDGLYYALASFTESAYSKTITHQVNNENLYLHKYDFNWSEIIHLIWKTDLLTWWYRSYQSDYDPCWKVDVTSIPLSIGEYENSNTYFSDCLLPMIFNAYGVDCKQYKKDCYTMMYNWYCPPPSFPPYDKEEMLFDIEDQWSEIHSHWIKEYGKLT